MVEEQVRSSRCCATEQSAKKTEKIMNTCIKQTKAVSRIATTAMTAAVALVAACLGDEVTHNAKIEFNKLSWTRGMEIPKFDQSLGKLESVNIQFQGAIRGDIYVESKSGLPATVTTFLKGTLVLRRPDQTDITKTEPEVKKVNDFPAYDRALDYSGFSGATYLRQYSEQSSSFSTTDPADLELFTATVPNETIALSVEATGQSSASGSGNLSTKFRTEASAEIAVTYAYRTLGEALVSIGDTVWLDSNPNGIQEPEIGELPINGVVLALDNTTVATGDVYLADPLADNPFGSGYYAFLELPPGEYTVIVAEQNFYKGGPLEGLVPTYDLDGGENNRATVTLGEQSGQSDTREVDFGYRPAASPGTGTPGYWKNHPQAWPVEKIEIGGVTYTKEEAIAVLNIDGKADRTFLMFAHLVSAKLNVGIGNDASCVADAILTADAWMTEYPLGSGVSGDSEAWDVGEPLKDILDAYNNGKLCAPHRDSWQMQTLARRKIQRLAPKTNRPTSMEAPRNVD